MGPHTLVRGDVLMTLSRLMHRHPGERAAGTLVTRWWLPHALGNIRTRPVQ